MGKVRPKIEEAIASAHFPQEEPEVISQVVSSKGDAIANSIPQPQNTSVPPVQPSSEQFSPGFGPAKPQPKAAKKLSQDEINVVCDSLKYLRINPDVCVGVIHKFWDNVGGAIARVRDALKDGWCQNATGLFIASCKKGLKAQKQVLDNGVKEWFEWARNKRLVIAMSGEIAYTPDGETVRLSEMMYLYPMR